MVLCFEKNQVEADKETISFTIEGLSVEIIPEQVILADLILNSVQSHIINEENTDRLLIEEGQEITQSNLKKEVLDVDRIHISFNNCAFAYTDEKFAFLTLLNFASLDTNNDSSHHTIQLRELNAYTADIIENGKC